MTDLEKLKNLINPKKNADKQFYLDLLDEEKQREWEDNHISAVLAMLKTLYVGKLSRRIRAAESEKLALNLSSEHDAEKYRRTLELNSQIAECKEKRDSYRCFFDEPYFGRMDLVDDKEGYNSYYIGKRGDEGLEIVDWRAPLARRYYQKSKLTFSINEYDYKLVLRRAVRTKSGRVIEYKNEYLSVGDNLTKEEIDGRDTSLTFDPFLKEILSSRKEKREICDIIETIQEKQYEIISAPESAEFVVQGVAGSGKTMILLHRLSCLLYNNENLKPSSVLVITPSDSFNAFIDELAEILELERVRTVTLENYYIRLLKSVGIELAGKIDYSSPVSSDYLAYVYSEAFGAEVAKKINKIYVAVRGMLPSPDDEFVASILNSVEGQLKCYEKIKNAGLRVRRGVLGEIKEKPDGGICYTRRMRELFNCVNEVKEFLTLNGSEPRMDGYGYFFRQFISFYKSLRFICVNYGQICKTALADLNRLAENVSKEIDDIKRYKQKIGDEVVFTYPDRIEKREQMKKEIEGAERLVESIASAFTGLVDFAEVIKGERYLVKIGKCENGVEIARYLFKEIVNPVKRRFGETTKKLIKSDAYALTALLCELGVTLKPAYAFVFVDEAQDVSPCEYRLLRKINADARFNVFGDLRQNVTPYRGVTDWSFLGVPVYELNLNYRNTNQIVSYVAENMSVEMQAIGLFGDEVQKIDPKGISSYLSGKQGLKAVITTDETLEKFTRRTYNVVRDTGVISKSKINILTVFESKGLEFTAVVAVLEGMSDNEKYIACTRALKELAVIY